MRLTILLAVALAMACADDVDSYVYVTNVHASITRTGNSNRVDHCLVTAKLPRPLLSAQPADGDTSRLGSDAATISQDLDNFDNDCDRHLHTWMHVTFAPSDRTSLHFDPKDAGITWQRLLVFVLGVMVLRTLARGKLRGRRERRRR